MYKTIIFLLLVFPNLIFGQDLIKIIDEENNEEYFVLKSDQTTKHGVYKRFTKDNALLIKGFYKHGVKDSIWKSYQINGELYLKYDYTKYELVYYNPKDIEKEKRYKIINDSNSFDTTLSRPPIYFGGDALLYEIIEKTIYPIEARQNRVDGQVFVLFTVDKFGRTSNYHFKPSIGWGLGEEAMRVLQLLPDFWLPGIFNEQPVVVEMVFPFRFKIE